MEKKYLNRKVILVDGRDRQVLPLAKEFCELGCHVTTINHSKLDLGYVTKYSNDKRLLHDDTLNKGNLCNYLFRMVKESRYDLVVTTSDDTAEVLANNYNEFEKYVNLAIPNRNIFYKAYNKNQTMKICMENGIPAPMTYFDIVSERELYQVKFNYPLVVKPKMGFGAKGFRVFNTKKELEEFGYKNKEHITEFVYQEFIPQSNIQYECSMFIDEKYQVKSAVVFSKNRWFPVEGGSSTLNITIDNQRVINICTKLLKEMKWVGAADIDLILDPRDNCPKVMEVNPRVSGSIKIVQEAGVNITKQILDMSLGYEVDRITEYKLGVRLRCIHNDFMWFLQSSQRFKATPSWFNWKNTVEQTFYKSDFLPFFAYSLQSLLRYRREMKNRRQL